MTPSQAALWQLGYRRAEKMWVSSNLKPGIARLEDEFPIIRSWGEEHPRVQQNPNGSLIFLSVRRDRCMVGESPMIVKLIIIIAFSYLYGAFEVFMNFRQRKNGTVTTSNDKGSLRLLYILITAGYLLSFSIGATTIGRVNHWNTYFAVGAVLVVIGLIIRIRSMLILRQYFTYSVAKVEGHKLIETGLYKIIRHPGYLGQLLIFLGISTSLSNWLSILAMMIPVAIGYVYRIGVEEIFMTEQLGQGYLNYQKRTKRIVPLIY
jgi:protein-S-isoprenylcysteine O-methyltransferase Ste14